MTAISTLRSHTILTGDVQVTPARGTLSLRANSPTVSAPDQGDGIDFGYGWSNAVFGTIKNPAKVSPGRPALLTLKANVPNVAVTRNIRVFIDPGIFKLSAKKLETRISFDEERRREEIELTEILAAFL